MLFAPYSTELLEGRTDGVLGGAEVQYALLAKSLPSIVRTAAIIQRPLERAIPNLVCVPLFSRPPPPRRWIVSFARYAIAIYAAIRKFRGAIVVQRCSGLTTFFVAISCRLTGNRFVYNWAGECDIRGEHISPKPFGGLLYRTGRALAHGQIVQTEVQERWAKGPNVVRVPNMLDSTIQWRCSTGSEVLWVGTIKAQFKQADLLLKMAASLPHREFVVAGRFGPDQTFNTAFKEAASRLPNLHLLGHVPREELPDAYGRARCLVNTSSSEGFSNTFLEAAASGVPIVSLNHNPDQILGPAGAGICANGSFEDLIAAIELMFDDQTWARFSSQCSRVIRPYTTSEVANAFALACSTVAK